MDFEGIKDIINAMDNSTLDYLEVNWQGISFVMKKTGGPQTEYIKKTAAEAPKEIMLPEEKALVVPAPKPAPPAPKAEPAVPEEDIYVVVSPIVGTFYEAAGPKKPKFVSVGSTVKAGDTLCILEAMKLMNEIQSEVNGEITEVLVKNEEMVEYNQPLFKIRIK
ncbi:MAG: acetyl-CoA carboxylase biotin carboxyl carrier protein [Clostridiaceae bacterium]